MDTPEDELKAFLAAHPHIEWLDAMLPDINGVPRGKRLSAGTLGKLYSAGILLPTSILASSYEGQTVEETGYGMATGDEDAVCLPVPGTLSPALWTDPPAGQVLLGIAGRDGGPVAIDPRTVLGQVVSRLGQEGYRATVAIELECYLIDKEVDGFGAPRPPRPPGGGRRLAADQLYGMEDIESFAGVLDAITQACRAMGVAITTALSEYGPGQLEINLPHTDDPVRACDQAILFKRAVRGAARQAGIDATFMAKPYPDKAGSGMHVHVSLTDRAGRAVFACETDPCPPALRHAIGGTLALMDESIGLLVPNMNGFRRFRLESFAPLKPCWGADNRTVAVRVPNSDAANRRLEHRVASADANPYLAVAAILAAVSHGLRTQTDPGAPETGNAYDGATSTRWDSWARALERLSGSEGLRTALGDPIVDAYCTVKQRERQHHLAQNSPIDYRWHL